MGGIVIQEGVLVRPYLLADKPVVDITFIQEDTIKRDFWISIDNMEDHTIYPKLICNIPNWSFEGVSYKELAGIGAGGQRYDLLHFWRAKPTPEYGVDLVDSGDFRVEIYNDAGYTDYYGGYDLPVDMRVVYLTAFPNVQQWSFYDGTNQGWTLTNMNISSARYFGGTRYAPRCYTSKYYPNCCTSECDGKISKTVILPNSSKVFIKAQMFLYAAARGGNSGGGDPFVAIKRIGIKFQDTYCLLFPERNWLHKSSSGIGSFCDITLDWVTIVADLSDFKGQTGVISLEGKAWASQTYGFPGSWTSAEACIDLVTIGGK